MATTRHAPPRGGTAEDDIIDILRNVGDSIRAADEAVNALASNHGYEKEANAAIKKAKQVIKMFKVEAIEAVQKGGAMTTRTFKCEACADGTLTELTARLETRLKQLTGRLENAKRNELKRGAAGPFDVSKAESPQEITDEAMRIQGQDLERVRRMQRMIGNTEEVAAATMSEMQRQTEQLGRIHQDLEEIDDTLKLAKKQIGMYLRRAATDKVIMAFTFLVVSGIVVIIILHAVGAISDDDVNVPDVVPDINV